MKVCWLSNYFSPYTIKQFEDLGKQVKLTALMLGGKDSDRNEEWKLNDNPNFDVILIDDNFDRTIKQLAKDNDVLIDSMYSSKYGIKAVNAFKKEDKITILQADGGIAIDRGFLINKAISFIMKRHDYFLSSGPHCDKYFMFYGIGKDKIYNYRFSSLTKADIENNKKSIVNKANYRKELNIDDKFTIVSVGRPVEGKGFDILLDSYMRTSLTDMINLYIVGGKPQDKIANIVTSNNLKNVHFIEVLNSGDLNKYYAMADIFALCTRTDVWGLVISEALSFGLPVITSKNCGAGVHFNLLSDCVMTCDVNDVNGYSECIKKLYNDSKLCNKLSNEALELIKGYTIENSGEDILNCLNKL